MAACIVCNQALAGDVQDGSEVAKLRTRLEQVLNETVPQGAVMCASCQFDLSQIEMYYALLTVFRKRYSETAKQRLQSTADDRGRNILIDTADLMSPNLQNIFGAVHSSETLASPSPSLGKLAGEGHSAISSAPGQLKIVDVQTVKEEFPDDASSDNTEPIGETLDEYPDPSSVVVSQKPETPRQIEGSTDVAPPRKRGRPRKNEQMSVVKKRTRPKKSKPLASPRTGVSDKKHKKLSAPAPGQTALETPESEVVDLGLVKVEVHDPATSSGSGIVAGHSAVNKGKQRKPQKSQDSSCNPVTRKKKEQQRKPEQDAETATFSGQRRAGRPRKDDPQPPFTCPVCNKVFNDRTSFTTHSKRHTDERPYVCSECGKAFKDSGGLRQHMRTHTLEKVFKCAECSSAFISQRALDRHSLVHTESRPFSCDQCEKTFKSQERLRLHVKLEHVQGRKFLCNICGLATYTVGNLRVHLLTHNEVKPFQCQTCGKRCSTKLTLRNHELSHVEGARPKHLCPICGKTFLNKSNLSPHIRLHTGEATHHCGICNKVYATGSIYRRHMLTHQDTRPHQCTQCGKAFTSIDNLRQHMKSHSDVRPFRCPCGSAFRQKDKLQKHLRSKIHAQYEAQLGSGPPATVAGVLDGPPPDPPASPEPLVMGLPLPTVVAPQHPAEDTLTMDRPVPVVIGSQQEELYTVTVETETVYL